MAPQVTRLYQAVLRDREAPISLRLHRAFSGWTETKGFPPASRALPNGDDEAGGARRTMERRGSGCGRYRLDEPCDGGFLRTEAVYAEPVPGMTGWVVVTVEQHGGGEPQAVGAPGFLPDYLRTARITDGAVHVEDAPVVLDETEVDRFVRTMTEPGRRVPVVVVSADTRVPGAERDRADRLAAAVAGAALVVRPADLRAQDLFNRVVGERLGVFGGAVRTYLAPFDPSAERRPERHPVMGGARLRGQGAAALDVIVDGVLGRTAHGELPGDVRRTMTAVRRVLAGTAGLEAIAAAAAPPPAPADPRREALRERMMALARRPRPPAPAGPAAPPGSAAPRPVPPRPPAVPPAARTPAATAPGGTAAVPDPGNGTGNSAGSGTVAGPADGPRDGGEAPALREAPAGLPVPAGTGFAQSLAGAVAGTVAGAVADAVVKELRGELESALSLVAGPGPDGGADRLLREIRVLGAHLSGLRDLLAERHGARPPAVTAEAGGRDADGPDGLLEEHRLLQAEYAGVVSENRRLAERVRRLERMLAEAGRPVYGRPETPGAAGPGGATGTAGGEEVFEPTGLVEVLVRARESLAHVVIGDTDATAARLDLEHPALCRTWAGKAWDALRALDDFAGARAAGEFAGGFYDWCAHGVPGRHTIPTGMLAMRESRSVTGTPRFSEPRTFPVPPEVDPSGRLLMEAHVKLRPVGYPAPRMYFHDDSGGATGKVWVGYLGDHLPNTRTN
ncbi:hypothetical protein GCM10010466_58440 [Planomonospora alba]|uniref:Uncharacterized protein n=1 Tax=Planomonospora alba TaxID=161354 RepID=A0ABP6P1F1_9ACTN